MLLADPFADRLTIPGIAHGDIFRPVLGWRSLGDHVEALTAEKGAGVGCG